MLGVCNDCGCTDEMVGLGKVKGFGGAKKE